MIGLLKLITKRPDDNKIRIIKVVMGLALIIIGCIAFFVQGLKLEDTFFWMPINSNIQDIFMYTIIGIGGIPLILGGADIHFTPRGYAKITQALYGVMLIIISGMFIERASLGVDLLYFLIGLVTILAGLSGKMITKTGLKHGQKVTKIRV